MHSYSGGPGSMAAKGLSVAERRNRGQPGGIVGLIFLAAFVAHDGQTLVSGSGGQLSPWVIEKLVLKPNGQMGVTNAKEVFYNDVPDAVASPAIANLRDQARSTAFTPCGPPAWADDFYNGRRAYVHTTLDNAIPTFAQDAMLQGSGVQWDTHSFNTGHCPFLSQPKQLSMWTDRQIAKFKSVRVNGRVAVS
ncbi:MAG: hypothetical protein Q9212_002720 [Teloschistes hypoglaucus]